MRVAGVELRRLSLGDRIALADELIYPGPDADQHPRSHDQLPRRVEPGGQPADNNEHKERYDKRAAETEPSPGPSSDRRLSFGAQFRPAQVGFEPGPLSQNGSGASRSLVADSFFTPRGLLTDGVYGPRLLVANGLFTKGLLKRDCLVALPLGIKRPLDGLFLCLLGAFTRSSACLAS